MNLLACRLVSQNGTTKLDFGGAGVLKVDDPRLLAQCRQARQPALVFGARPEQLGLRPAPERASAGEASLVMPVTFVERVGARTIVHLECDGRVVKVAEKNGYQAQLGAPMSIVVPTGAALLFDAESERRLPQ